MPTPSNDREILKILIKKIGVTLDEGRARYESNHRLIYLNLSNMGLSHLPVEIWELTNLEWLSLENNQLSSVSKEIGELTKLEMLSLENNQLSRIPLEIGKLANLQRLYLQNNQLSRIPAEIGKLTKLEWLSLENNQLSYIPVEIGKLTKLKRIFLENNPSLLTVPPEIVARGTSDILAFLRELEKNSITRYEAKLLVVGEGGTGKSSLLRAIREQEFDSTLSTTHGIEVDRLPLPYSKLTGGEITLNTWDFGGQQIYHATHQFFLTKRSLYMVVWNARQGVEQGRLDYWLETIRSLAPDAPVLLVATHIDERAPDINYQSYKGTYPQLVGHLSVSNANGTGITELKTTLTNFALQLPIMGQPWPKKWVQVEERLLSRFEHHINAESYIKTCSNCGVEVEFAQGTLGHYLHDLGKILYFRDDYVLSNLVVLKPNWVTKAISRVLTDETTRKAHGILLHSDLSRIWGSDEEGQPYQPYLYPVFLRLMERFYLSYQIEADPPGDHSTRSLIPQLLPFQPPPSVPSWPKIPGNGQTQVEMVYRFDFVPAGIMSWFIVRTHRYTTNLHWREGVVLAYQDHYARVELNPMKRELRLVVWGLQPHNFFTILMHTVDVIFARFQGLIMRREIPCICHWERKADEPCLHFYRYEELVRRMEARRFTIECPESFTDVSVPVLLYGIHTSTDSQVILDIKEGQQRVEKKLDDLQKLDVILGQLSQLSELFERNFARQWNLEMHRVEIDCPSTFMLMPGGDSIFNPRNWMGKEYRLYLLCQHPPRPHRVKDSYPLRKAEDWWVAVSPWFSHLVNFLKFAVPMFKAIEGVYDAEAADVKLLQASIGLIDQIASSLVEIPAPDQMKHLTTRSHMGFEQHSVGPALRALHSFLLEADPIKYWGGLHQIFTPDGNILCLCEKHRQQYEAKPLRLDV
ncbi:MAG: hypothetical protein NVSMB27_29160 [Ktedonobacteraceae bacterium]